MKILSSIIISSLLVGLVLSATPSITQISQYQANGDGVTILFKNSTITVNEISSGYIELYDQETDQTRELYNQDTCPGVDIMKKGPRNTAWCLEKLSPMTINQIDVPNNLSRIAQWVLEDVNFELGFVGDYYFAQRMSFDSDDQDSDGFSLVYDFFNNKTVCKIPSSKKPDDAYLPAAANEDGLWWKALTDSIFWQSCKELNDIKEYKAPSNFGHSIATSPFQQAKYYLLTYRDSNDNGYLMVYSSTMASNPHPIRHVPSSFGQQLGLINETLFWMVVFDEENHHTFITFNTVDDDLNVVEVFRMEATASFNSFTQDYLDSNLWWISSYEFEVLFDMSKLQIVNVTQLQDGQPMLNFKNGSRVYPSSAGAWIQNPDNSFAFISYEASDLLGDFNSEYFYGMYLDWHSSYCSVVQFDLQNSQINEYDLPVKCGCVVDDQPDPAFILDSIEESSKGVFNIIYRCDSTSAFVIKENKMLSSAIYIRSLFNNFAPQLYANFVANEFYIILVGTQVQRLTYSMESGDQIKTDNIFVANLGCLITRLSKDLVLFAHPNLKTNYQIDVYNITNLAAEKKFDLQAYISGALAIQPVGIDNNEFTSPKAFLIQIGQNELRLYNQNGEYVVVQDPARKDQMNGFFGISDQEFYVLYLKGLEKRYELFRVDSYGDEQEFRKFLE